MTGRAGLHVRPTVVKERFIGEYVFFQDEFGEWAFKIKQQKSEQL